MQHRDQTDTGPARRLIRFDALETEITDTADRAALFLDRGFRKRLFQAIDGLLLGDDGAPGLLSLDVFDTILLRDGSSELRRFVDIGARMADAAGGRVTAMDAFAARHLGTTASYRAGPRVDGCGEGSLTEIHRTAARILGLSDDLADRFIEAELTYEVTRLTPNTALLAYMERHRKRGGRIVLISDMYMHAEQIADLLGRCGVPPRLWDALYSSADTKVSKASGGIFARVTEAAGVPRILHLGDSLRGDYQSPRAAGWQAMLLPVPRAVLRDRSDDRVRCLDILRTRHGLAFEREIAA